MATPPSPTSLELLARALPRDDPGAPRARRARRSARRRGGGGGGGRGPGQRARARLRRGPAGALPRRRARRRWAMMTVRGKHVEHWLPGWARDRAAHALARVTDGK